MQSVGLQQNSQITRRQPCSSRALWPHRPNTCRQVAASAALHMAAAPSHFIMLAAAEPFATPDTLLPLSSIADMRNEALFDTDSFFSASPYSTMRRFDDMMQQQFESMDPFEGSSGFTSMSNIEERMQQQMREMDRQLDRAFGDMDRAQREMDAELQRSLRQLQEQQPGVRIERRQEKSPGTYRYYESIQISSGTGFTTLTPAHSTFFNPLLLAAVVLAGAYAAVTAAFARNYDLTTYGDRAKWRLLLLWPVLSVFSKPFWRQFSSALRGEKVRVKEDEVSNGSSGPSS